MNAAYLPFRLLLLIAVLVSVVGHASAQAEPELNVDTPAIASLKKSMANRFTQMKPHLDAGVVGLAQDGVVVLRDPATIDVKALLTLDALINEENRDRATLYREIARANSRPEWEADLRAVFGKRWISRMPAGWFYRNDKGQWIQKLQ